MYESGFEPEMIPSAMLAHRIIGIMAHFREYTRRCKMRRYLPLPQSDEKQ